MSEFLVTEAIDEDENEKEESEGNNFVSTLSDDEFIDDESQFDDQNASDYYGFINVERSYNDAIQDSLANFNFDQEANNYNYEDCDFEEKIDDFQNYNERLSKFKETLLFPLEIQNDDSFFYSILYAVRYHFTKKFDKVSDEEINQDIAEIFEKIYRLKNFLKLDLKISTFEDQCYTINHILNKNNLFLCVYEKKDKFRYITNTEKDKKNIIREISSCVKEKFNGFIIVRVDFDHKIQRNFTPIDIVYKPVKNQNEIIDCYFTDKMHLAYRTTFNETIKTDKLKHTNAFRCHFCTKFFVRKIRFEKHLNSCNGKPGF